MKITKTQKGITLLALIITIVVLLILAGVAINSIENTNLIDQASAAGQKWNEAQGNESTTLGGYESEIDKILNPCKWVQDGDLVKKVRAKDGTVVTTLVVGNFVEGYNPTGLSESENMGTNNWIVLGAKNGELLIVSQTPKFTSYGYNNIFKKYANQTHATGARSLNVEDLVFKAEYSLASIHEYGISDTELGGRILNSYSGNKWWQDTVSGTDENGGYDYSHVRPVYLGDTIYVESNDPRYTGTCDIAYYGGEHFYKDSGHNNLVWYYVVVSLSGSAEMTDAGLNS